LSRHAGLWFHAIGPVSELAIQQDLPRR